MVNEIQEDLWRGCWKENNLTLLKRSAVSVVEFTELLDGTQRWMSA
jgi:hypothetical protein